MHKMGNKDTINIIPVYVIDYAHDYGRNNNNYSKIYNDDDNNFYNRDFSLKPCKLLINRMQIYIVFIFLR